MPRPRLPIGLLLCLVLAGSATRGGEATVNGVVSAASPEAAEAGAEILALGGNAVDAAVAVALALGVTEPAGSGLAGQAIVLIQQPGKPAVVVNGTTFAPRTIPHGVNEDDLEGRRATTVPSLLRVLDLARSEYGSDRVPWKRLVEPAIRYAEEGFPLGRFRQRALERYDSKLRRDPTAARVFLDHDRNAPPVGAVVRQPDLARTLKRIANEGSQDFYNGEIAREIAADMERHGGWLTLEDLRNHPDPKIEPALRASYRGWDVYTTPPPAGGWVVLQALNLLERADRDLDRSSRTIWMAESLRAAHRSRAVSPVQDLEDYGDDVERRISKQAARKIAARIEAPGAGETTHFVVVDATGLTVSASLSINDFFGSGVMHPRLGFLYNDYMKAFRTDRPGHPYQLRGGAMPYSSMSATIVSRDGRPRLALGSPGSRRIVSAVVQVVSNWIDEDMDVEAAVAAPRIHVIPEKDELLFETRPSDREMIRALRRRDFDVDVAKRKLSTSDLNPYFGGVHAVASRDGKRWRGAADPRRDGRVRSPSSLPREGSAASAGVDR